MPPQIVRLVFVTIAIAVGYFAARKVLTPDSFGQYGHFRGNALALVASRAPVYAGQKACDECHSEILAKVAKAPHAPVSCEACHAACQAHAANPEVKTDKLTDGLCARCHERTTGRPAWHKQINLKNHYNGQGACKTCHIPHQPNDTP
ncbi:MAG: hypothetical protein WCO56_03270 [Verrucomicrobiota bacterium]